MRSCRTLLASLAAAALAACGPDVPVPPAQADAAAVERQARAFTEAMKPRHGGRPVIAVLARNEGTETTDFLVTHAVLQRAGVADVRAVAPRRGRVSLYPTLEVEVPRNLEDFDREHPDGADYVVVPAMDDADDAAISAWLKAQAAKGARVIGVCAGALIVGRAGLLDGRRFTTHWYFRDTLLERHPGAVYVPHQRYVVDRGVATTTGVTASLPAMLALVEAIGGRARAQALAAELGADSWGPEHDSAAFGLDAGGAARYVLAKAAFWRREDLSVEVRHDMEDVGLALAADAWTRTGHVRVEAAAPGPVKLRSGMVLIAEPAPRSAASLSLAPALKPVEQLDHALCEIGKRFGEARRDWVMMELEYADDFTCR